MRTLEAGSVEAVVTDPPYFKVKDEEWDRQWESESSFLDWIGELCTEWYRLLKPNGSLFVFASPRMSARVELKVAETFNVLNRITWRKPNGRWSKANKETLRSFFPASESIIFAENYGADNMAKGEAGYVAKCDELRGFVFEPLRAYLAEEWWRAGLKQEDANKACGTASMAGHFFSRAQWCLPTEQHYEALRKYANAQGGEFLRREYEELRREYEELRREYEELRRPFNVTPDVPYTDIWDFKTVAAYPGKHPCEKPVALMQHIVTTSTLPGAVVLDCFMGSGSTGAACARSGRGFIGIEKDAEWLLKAQERLKRESGQGNLFDKEESA